MPESPTTGALGGRDHTRPPAGFVRIDLQPDGMITLVTDSTTVRDRVIEVTVDLRTTTYVCESGTSWNVPRDWHLRDLLPLRDLTVVMTRRPGPRPGGGVIPPRYAAGGAVTATMNGVNFPGGNVVTFGYTNPTTTVHQYCGCQVCQENRLDQGFWDGNDQERQIRLAREETERRRKLAEADERAEETLRMVLCPDELAHYDETGEIIITGADGWRYRIARGIVNNVHLLDRKGEMVAALCCHPRLVSSDGPERMPDKDAHIGQILYLRHDWANFWATANVSWLSAAARDEYFDRNQSARIGQRTRRAFWMGAAR